MDSPLLGTNSQTVVTENWLTRKPHSEAALVTGIWVMLVCLASLCFWADIGGLSQWMTASKGAVFGRHEYWRAWTTLFVHADGRHLLSNMVLYFVLGFFLNGYFGLWLVPLSSVLCGGLVNLIVLSGMPKEVQLVGISGVVLWMAGAWLLLYFLIETRRSWFQRTLRSFGVALAMFMPTEAFDPAISYRSHWWGFVIGLLWGLLYFLVMKKPLREAEVRVAVIEEAEAEEDENEVVSETN
jgi:rhomboid protease GluP